MLKLFTKFTKYFSLLKQVKCFMIFFPLSLNFLKQFIFNYLRCFKLIIPKYL